MHSDTGFLHEPTAALLLERAAYYRAYLAEKARHAAEYERTNATWNAVKSNPNATGYDKAREEFELQLRWPGFLGCGQCRGTRQLWCAGFPSPRVQTQTRSVQLWRPFGGRSEPSLSTAERFVGFADRLLPASFGLGIGFIERL